MREEITVSRVSDLELLEQATTFVRVQQCAAKLLKYTDFNANVTWRDREVGNIFCKKNLAELISSFSNSDMR